MNKIDILIAVDVAGALAAGSLTGCVYLVDTNGYLGSWNEGTSSLSTACQDGQLVSWSVTPVDAGSAVSIAGFSGDCVDQKICVPAADPFQGAALWNARIESQGSFASVGYQLALEMSGRQMAAPAALKIV